MRTALVAILLLAYGPFIACAMGKERHFEQVRALLMVRAAKCTTCHSNDSGTKLNLYGEKLAQGVGGLTWADRLVWLESGEKSPLRGPGNPGEEKEGTPPTTDVDGDGVLNWVEILAGANPGSKEDHPDDRTVQRITGVINCTLCHRATGLPGAGLEANPHNKLGELLATTVDKKRPRKPIGREALHEAAEALPILKRISIIKNKKPPESQATYWQRIRLLRSTTDAADAPTVDSLKAFKKAISRQKRAKPKDRKSGFDHPKHRLDGFLTDAQALE